ncbi:MAG: hypothetical protein ACRDK7_15145 [Solirubrobacteraceae bacterium]
MCQNQTPRLLAVTTAEECVDLIMRQAAVAPEEEVPGLTSALECLLSLDDRDAGQLVAQLRRRVDHTEAVAPRGR